ncbi:MAG TPA: transglycosylase domain-containing protein [Candidatus Udaeobacter sp.]|jgi:membrane peptidoglycan carboxypeptidase|nr:transglycosylase domain-containing protein [Candidatus Udaeobacter sp.]
MQTLREHGRRILGAWVRFQHTGSPYRLVVAGKIPAIFLGATALLAALITIELRTAAIQSRFLALLASQFTWQVGPGGSPRIGFPREGPFDVARGYTRIPEFEHQLDRHGYRLAEQSRVSPLLALSTTIGFSAPVPERAVTGLVIRDRDGQVLYDATARRHRFERFADIPPVVTQTLGLMEDQHLWQPSGRVNPAVDWGRLLRAAVFDAAHHLGFPVAFQGGSTLAIQMEKYRHSEDGRTGSPADKLWQIAAADLRVFHDGANVRDKQRQIVVDYLNSVPLGGAPGYGEVHGLGEGLRAWFDLDPNTVFPALRHPGHGPKKARALKPVLALLCAVRAPARLLGSDHDDLARRVAFYERRLARSGVIDATLARRLSHLDLKFATASPTPVIAFDRRKAADATRRQLLQLLGIKSLYDLDKLDLEVQTSIDGQLQAGATRLFQQLRNSAFVDSTGLRGEHLLASGDPSRVTYTMLLFDRQPDGDVVRLRADNLDQPFDLNSSMRMELGSTAKLRTLAHYLEIVERLHHELGPKSEEDLAAISEHGDPITAWAAGELLQNPSMPLDTLLAHSLEREYSANPDEAFFTGGGIHLFRNFDPDDNHRRRTVREAFEHSTNLVFVRVMRDVVRYHEARLPYDAAAVLNDPENPLRNRMLSEAADEESQTFLRRAYRELKGVAPAEIPHRLFGPAPSGRELAAFYFASHRDAPPESLASWLTMMRGTEPDPALATKMTAAYGDTAFSWLDYAYLLRTHPLELWCAAELARDTSATFADLVERSRDVRADCQQWLFNPRHRAAQDNRLRIRIERDAFDQMTVDWKRLGFPFERLVPSFATAIGSSADRPEALAKLMGIIVGDGTERPTRFIQKLRFGPGTPYETVFEPTAIEQPRVMSTSVARTLKSALAGVVERGTAHRVEGVFQDASGDTLEVGGKTGSGDNRVDAVTKEGFRSHSRAINRTAAFAFYVSDRCYGVVTASVDGPEAAGYGFTSALPLEMLRRLAPEISARLAGGD